MPCFHSHFPPVSSSTVMPKIFASFLWYFRQGSHLPLSHQLTADWVTFIFFASCACVMPTRLRWALMSNKSPSFLCKPQKYEFCIDSHKERRYNEIAKYHLYQLFVGSVFCALFRVHLNNNSCIYNLQYPNCGFITFCILAQIRRLEVVCFGQDIRTNSIFDS